MSSAKPASEIRVVASLALLYVFRMLGLFMVIPIMMIYGREYSGQTPYLLGVALGIYGITQAIFQIPLGLLSDIWGRKQVIFLGLLVFVLGSVVAATADSVWGVIFGRALQGAGAIASAVLALVGDLTSEQNRTKAMAVIGISIGLSFTVALSIGPKLAALGGLGAIFWLSAALAAVGILVLFFAVPNPPKGFGRGTEGIAVPKLLSQTLKNAELLRMDVGIFVLHFMLTATFVGVPLALENAGLAGELHSQYYWKVMLLAFLGMVPFMYFAERKRQVKLVMLLAIALLAIAELLLIQMAASTWQAVFGAVLLFFIAFNILEATLPSLLSKVAPAGSKGTAMGVYSTCQFLGAALGGIVGGFVLERWELSGVFLIAAILGGVWLLVACFMKKPRYLSSLCVPLESELSEAELQAHVPGVAEAIWVQEQGLLYLKVEEKLFEKARLESFLKTI